MLDWLRKLLGVPRPIVIEIDRDAIAIASSGDLVILRYAKRLTPEGRAELGEYLHALRSRYPDIRFEILDDQWAQVAVATGRRK